MDFVLVEAPIADLHPKPLRQKPLEFAYDPWPLGDSQEGSNGAGGPSRTFGRSMVYPNAKLAGLLASHAERNDTRQSSERMRMR